MERAKETRFLDSHALLSDHLCVAVPYGAEESEKEETRKIESAGERGRENGWYSGVSVHSRATCNA